MTTDYITVTEIPGAKASKEQVARLFQRYHFALPFCRDKEVLEIACGAGLGLGYIAKVARRVVGGDIDENNLRFAREHYQGRDNVVIQQMDAHKLPFDNGSFDVVILYEAVYYLAQPVLFFAECQRVLKSGGVLLICSVNKDWPDFNPSPYSTEYFSVQELHRLLAERFGSVELYGAFEASANRPADRVVSLLKRTAVNLHLMPKTMKGKEILKRMFFGRLSPLPAEIEDGIADYVAPVPIPGEQPDRRHKVIYAVARTNTVEIR